MSEFVLALCCLGCWANGVIIGWCLYDFKFYKRNLDKAREVERLLDNAEKTYLRAEFVSELLKGTREKYKEILKKYSADKKMKSSENATERYTGKSKDYYGKTEKILYRRRARGGAEGGR